MTESDHPPPDRPSQPDIEDFDRRLTARLQARQAQEGRRSSSVHMAAGGLGLAMRMSLEFAAAVGVGAFLGAGIDQFAGSSPWGLLVGLGLGFAAGVRGVVRAAYKMQATADPSASASGSQAAPTEVGEAARGKDEPGRGE